MAISKTQTEHLQRILRRLERDLSDKYIRGAEEHKTTLSQDHNALEIAYMMLEEAIDQVTYAYTLIEYLENGNTQD